MSSQVLAGLGGVVLSLLFSYAPGLQAWYGKLTSQAQSLIMLACIVVVALVAFGLSCAGFENITTCDETGAYGLLKLVVAVAITSQTTYILSPQKK